MRPKTFVISSILFIFCLGFLTPGSAQVTKHWNSMVLNPDWSTPAYWSPIGNPTAIDSAMLGGLAGIENRIVNLDQDVTIANLEILSGMTLQGVYDSLNVTGDTVVAGVNDDIFESTLRLGFTGGGGYTLQTDTLSILDGALVHLQAYSVANIHDSIFVGADSELRGNAVINLNGNGARSLINDGVIRPQPSGLEIFQHGSGLIDLDGNGNGVIDLTYNFLGNADMTVHGTSLNDHFDGELLMVSGAYLNMDLVEPWTLAAGSQLVVSPATSNAYAIIDGQALDLRGEVLVEENAAWLRFNADTSFESTSEVTLQENAVLETLGSTEIQGGSFSVANDAYVLFFGDTLLQDGTFVSPSYSYLDGGVALHGPTEWDGQIAVDGILRQMGDATVSGNTVVYGGLLDLDGDGDVTWDINNSLTLYLWQVDTWQNRFDGTFDLFATLSQVNVNLEDPEATWIMNGTMNIGNSLHFPLTRLSGSPVSISGAVNLSGGTSRFTADATFTDTSTLDFDDADVELLLTSQSEIQMGATVVGEGTVVNASNGHLVLGNGSSLNNASLENHGVLEIGTSAGIADVSQFESSATANWIVQIGGPVSGTEHDLLLIGSGDAVLAGNLCVRLIDVGNGTYDPVIGDEFTILSAVGGIVGQFDGAPVSVANGNAYHWEVLYGFNEVTLRLDSVVPNVYLGDVNEDGAVDLLDVAPFVELLTTGEYMLQADINCDGSVDLLDVQPFIELLTN